MKKVLFVTMSAIESNTSSIQSNIAIIRGLSDMGYYIDVLSPKSVENSNYSKYKFNDNVNFVRIENSALYTTVVKQRSSSKIKSSIISLLRKIYYKFKILDNASSVAKNINLSILEKKEYDIVISASDPKSSHIAMKNLINQGLKYETWIEYWGDPLVLDITCSCIYPKFILKKIEERMIADADKIIYVSPLTLEKQKQLYPRHKNKMHFLPLPYDCPVIYPIRENTKALSVGYFGDYNSKIRNILPLYESCKKTDKYQLTICGNSDLELQEGKNINVYERVMPDELKKYEGESDVIACVLNNKGTQIPGKIFYLAGTNKTLLIILDGENKDVVKSILEKYNRYIFCDNNSLSITKALEKIRNNQSLRSSFVCTDFSSMSVAKELLKLI